MHAIGFHELGHDYTLQWPLPSTSDNEQIADLFSVWVTVKLMNDPAAALALANYRFALAYVLGKYQHHPGWAVWEQAESCAVLARLAGARPSWRSTARKLTPKKHFDESNFITSPAGPFAGLEDLLQPIATMPLSSGPGGRSRVGLIVPIDTKC